MPLILLPIPDLGRAPTARAALAPLLLLVGLSACAGGADADKDSGGISGDGGDGGGDGGVEYEEGCILVDGAGGYRWINDAIAVASPGSVIELCAEEGHEEAVVVNKAVQIVGPGPDSFGLVAPTNTVGLTVTADGASVSGLRIDSLRSGISVEPAGAGGEGPADVLLEDVSVVGAGNWGIQVQGARSVVIRGATLSGNGYGGLNVEGAVVTIESSIIADNVGYGIFADAVADVTAVDCAITGTLPSNPDDIADGHGMFGTGGARIAAEGSDISNNAFVNVFSEDGDLSLATSTLTGALYGVVGLSGEASVVGTTITDGAYHGLYLQGPSSIQIEETVVSGDPALTVDLNDATWGVADDTGAASYLGLAAFLVSDDIRIIGSQFIGYNDGGALIAGLSSSGSAAVIEDTQFTDNGRRGIYIAGIATTATNMVVSGQREVEDTGENRCLIVDQRGGVLLIQAPLTLIGGSVLDNEGYGISNVQGVVTAVGLEVAGNWCAGMMNFRGAMDIEAGDFSRPGKESLSASVTDYEGLGLTVVGSSFHDAQTAGETVYEYDYTDYIAKYVYQDFQGIDVYAISGSRVELTDNVFARGTSGVVFSETDATMVSNSFDDYLGYGLQVFSSTLTMRETSFRGAASEAVYCSGGNVNVEDSTFSDNVPYTSSMSYYEDDVLVYTSESVGATGVIYASDCNVSLEAVEFRDLLGGALRSYTSAAGSYVLANVQMENINQSAAYSSASAIDVFAYYGVTDVILDDVSIINNGRDAALEVTNNPVASPSSGTVNLSLTDVVVNGSQTEGLRLTGGGIVADIDGVTVSNASVGLRMEYGAFTVDNLNLSGMAGGVNLGAGSGLTVNGGTYTMGLGTSTANETYGLMCYGAPTIDSCDGLDLSGNTLGPSFGCEAACPAVPE